MQEKFFIKIKNYIYDSIIQHAKEEFPIEACGYLVGNDNEINKIFKMKNKDNSEEHFSFEPEEQFKVIKEVRKSGLNIIGVYHSHPFTPPRLSDEDIKLAYDRTLIYAIVSLQNNIPIIKFFKFYNNEPKEITFVITE